MKALFIAVLLLVCATGAQADGVTPWVDDAKLKDQVESDLRSGGILSVKPHADDIEHALAGAKQSIALAHDAGISLANGSGDIMASILMMSKENRSVSVIQNPYPLLALYLGSYYEEIGHPDEALRVLDIGLAAGSSKHPGVVAERGAALNGLKRFDESLANYDDGLKIANLDADMKARYERGRGYALTELGRLDEAEAAYQDSLKDAPGNPTAENELKYLAGLKAGRPKAEGGILPVQQTPENPPAKP